jgi:hypothetical protein
LLKEGDLLELNVVITRRKDKNPHNVWVLAVDFSEVTRNVEFTGDFVDVKNPKARVERFIDEALIIAKKIPGVKGKRVQAYLELADQVGYPQLLELWYYNAVAVEAYSRASEHERKKMFADAGGTFPLTGELQGYQYPPSWQVYPFRKIPYDSYEYRPEEDIKTMLGALDERIKESLSSMIRGEDLAGNQYAMRKEPLWMAFREHVRSLMTKDTKHLYFIWASNTPDDRSAFERLYGP